MGTAFAEQQETAVDHPDGRNGTISTEAGPWSGKNRERMHGTIGFSFIPWGVSAGTGSMRAKNIFEKKDFRDGVRVFRDREDAGLTLGKMLEAFRDTDALVLTIPAGGVPVAAKVSEMLSLPLDVAVVSKITLPWNSESGFGAVAEDGTVRLNREMLHHIKLLPAEVEKGVSETKRKVMRRANFLRGSRPFPDLRKRPVILIDDGLASGITMSVAVLSLKNREAGSIHVAVPTGHVKSVEDIAADVESLYCANIRGGFSFAVADAYDMWTDVPEKEAKRILERYRD